MLRQVGEEHVPSTDYILFRKNNAAQWQHLNLFVYRLTLVVVNYRIGYTVRSFGKISAIARLKFGMKEFR